MSGSQSCVPVVIVIPLHSSQMLGCIWGVDLGVDGFIRRLVEMLEDIKGKFGWKWGY